MKADATNRYVDLSVCQKRTAGKRRDKKKNSEAYASNQFFGMKTPNEKSFATLNLTIINRLATFLIRTSYTNRKRNVRCRTINWARINNIGTSYPRPLFILRGAFPPFENVTFLLFSLLLRRRTGNSCAYVNNFYRSE